MKSLMFVAAFVLAWPSLARAQNQTSARALFEFLDYTDPSVLDSSGGPAPRFFEWVAAAGFTSAGGGPVLFETPFPLDVYAGISGRLFWSAPPPPLPGGAMWAFANETGRVRALAQTAFVSDAPPTPKPGHRFKTFLTWEKTFLKGSAGDTAKFTVNPATLALFINKVVDPKARTVPYAAVQIEILLDVRRPDKTVKSTTAFTASVKLVTKPEPDRHNYPCQPVAFGPDIVWKCEAGRDARTGPVFNDSPLHGKVVDSGGDDHQMGVRLKTSAYHGSVDLGSVGLNRKYTIRYILTAEAHGLGGETESFAQIGDPLDVDSGMSLDVTSLPAADDRPQPHCDVSGDALRFHDNRDGTVTDGATGLMWQRCPLGFRLADAATPDDLTDDRCVASGSNALDWASAQQAAADDDSAGHSDWRLPDIKELDSIVELDCLDPAIDPTVFPDTPPVAFWSSTPAPGGNAAMTAQFLTGAIQPQVLAAPAAARLVRVAGLPVALPAGLRVLPAVPVFESDPTPRELVFPVVLDGVADADVTFHFATADETARAGDDYQAVSGTLTIPRGEVGTEVHVPVLDDALGEPGETLALVIDQVSSSARLLGASATGAIIDDEPLLSVGATDAYEGDALVFWVTLDRPAAAAVTVSYATTDGTARAGEDYQTTQGLLTIPAGQRAGSITVPGLVDGVREPDETVLMTLTGPSDAVRLGRDVATGLIVDDEVLTMAALDDTGMTTCDNESQSGLVCPLPGFPGQDGDEGRDVAFPSDADGANGFVFTKLDADGQPLPDQTVPFGNGAWSCIRDEVTGLWWEVKTNDGGLRDRDFTYSWFDSSGHNDGGSPGTPNGGTCVDTVNCDTEKLVARVNAVGLCGHADWRLPEREELFSLHDSASPNALDQAWFPNSPITFPNNEYWTATAIAVEGGTPSAWVVTTGGQGSFLIRSRSTPSAVRLVRGGNAR